jgi:phosphoribosylformimino-5-aminoimidazole carboxamide ribotide isomerase
MTIVPSIDLRNGKVVRLQQGDYSRQLNYAVDPVEQARGYAAAGAAWMHIVDLDGAKEGRCVQTDLIASIVRGTALKVQVGGGVRSEDDIERLLAAGVARVVVGTRALEAWDWFKALAQRPGMAAKLVLAVDAKDGVIATRGWTQLSGRTAVQVAEEVSEWGLGAILYTDVAKDGMMQGPNFRETRKLVEAGKTPVIASGGVGGIEHVRELLQVGCWGVIVGRSLYEGTLDLKEALTLAGEQK